MQIEVPSDKYDAAVSAMEEKIRRGQVNGVTDPAEAKKIVKKDALHIIKQRTLLKQEQ